MGRWYQDLTKTLQNSSTYDVSDKDSSPLAFEEIPSSQALDLFFRARINTEENLFSLA